MSYEALNDDQRGGTTLNGKTSYTIDQAAAQLDRAGLSWSATLGQPATVTYAYRASAPATMPDDAAGFQRFSGPQVNATETALALWARVANITFVRVDDGNGYSDNATILFGDYTSGEKGSDAFAVLPGNRAAASATGDVWVNSTYSENANVSDRNDYGFLTLLHEIGHSIGLLHPSDYDSTDKSDTPITYAHDASYAQDSIEYSVMSYFDPAYTGGFATVDAPATPLIDDVAAAQRLYGANMSTNTGNDTYGDVPNRGGNLTDDPRQPFTSFAWGTIWDAGGYDTLSARQSQSAVKLDLHQGAFSDMDGGVGTVSIAKGTVIENAEGSRFNDTLVGNDADNVLWGNAGDDTLRGGTGADIYIGGDGNDRAILNGNASDYALVTGPTADLLEARNGSGDQFVYGSTETVQFQNGQYLALKDLPAYVQPAFGSNVAVSLALIGGDARFAGTSALDRVVLPGLASDYMLSRTQDRGSAGQGDFRLTSRMDGSVYSVGEQVDAVQFQSGQYVSLKDLPAYVAGSAALEAGGDANDILLQTKTGGVELLIGGGGSDDAYLKGNVWDYALQPFTAGAGVQGSAASGGTYAGMALVWRNGGGTTFVDQSVDIIRFQNGQYLSYRDLAAYVGATGRSYGATLQLVPDVDGTTHGNSFTGTAGPDRMLLNGNVQDYTLGRDGAGDFVLTPHDGSAADPGAVSLGTGIETVQFRSGQYLSLPDLPAYVGGNAVFTSGTPADDLLYAGFSGDQHLTGGQGIDHAYLHGNVRDYRLASYAGNDPYAGAAVSDNPYHGYELIATNGSGNIYVDSTVEYVHFQNGQYLSYNDLPAYIVGA